MKTSLLVALALLTLPAPALAQSDTPVASRKVQTADLNLSTKADQARLGHRIRHAVNSVCGEAIAADLAGQNQVKRCRDETRASVQAQVEVAIAAAARATVVASAE